MLREVAHFVRHAPGVAALARRLPPAALYHLLAGRADDAGLRPWRARLVSSLSGRVLEIGCGTGHMFPHYGPGVRVVALDVAADFLALARGGAPRPALVLADAGRTPFADASFDAVVGAGVLCSVRSVAPVLAEARRLLRDGGELRLLEHVRSARPWPGLLMDAFNPLWRLYNRQGCNMNRRPERALADAGFELLESAPFQLFPDGVPAFPSRMLFARPAARRS